MLGNGIRLEDKRQSRRTEGDEKDEDAEEAPSYLDGRRWGRGA